MRQVSAMRKAGVAVVAVTAILLSACGSSSSSGSSGSSSGSGTVSANNTVVTWAEPPAAPPNYIFPFMGLAFFSVYNSQTFQYLMYRPLYWFGEGATPNLNLPLSLATAPVYNNTVNTVTVNLNSYKWSNGETVTAQNVMFWMNMLHAEKANWAGYSAGALPDDIKSIVVNSPEQLTFTLTAPVNNYWFTYNELSQITPMPNAWDITATGGAANSGGCAAAPYGTADTQCKAVYTFLSKQAGYDPANPKAANNSLSTYATNPIWQVVDGPWRLSHFDAEGNVTLVPNPSYSGPVKPTIKKFVELPYTSDSSEFNALVGGKVTVGYIPIADIPGTTTDALKSGPNNARLSNFRLEPLEGWAINYFPYNFNSTGDGGNAGAIFKQLYFRQAVQLLVDQPLYNQKIFKGYSVGTYGPVPSEPASSFVSSQVQNNTYYPYNPGKAVSLLKDHGWKVVPNGTSTCASPGTGPSQCGANIPSGAKLSFNLQYASGVAATTQLMDAEKSSWSQAGIDMNLSQASFNSVIGTAVPCTGGSSCSWELQNWGAGWIFSPDYYPTGEEIFQTGAGSNSGSYSDSVNDSNISATNATQTSLTAYENYLAQQLPVIYQPNAGNPLYEVQKNLEGFSPASPLQGITPESWHFSS